MGFFFPLLQNLPGSMLSSVKGVTQSYGLWSDSNKVLFRQNLKFPGNEGKVASNNFLDELQNR